MQNWEQKLDEYEKFLIREEKSAATMEKYVRDVAAFLSYVGGKVLDKELVVEYKKSLEEKKYQISSINSMLASLNNFLMFLGHPEFKVKMLKLQRKIYSEEERELNKADYMKLLEATKNQKQLNLIFQTICGTGICVSELKYFTVEGMKKGKLSVYCKNKTRPILVPEKLRKSLINYAKEKNIRSGCIFVTRTGKPLDRSNIWKKMKKICKSAGVNALKVFPHNFRKLFAKIYYKMEKDIAKLADILGHGSIETTRIYIMTTGLEHRRQIEKLGLVI